MIFVMEKRPEAQDQASGAKVAGQRVPGSFSRGVERNYNWRHCERTQAKWMLLKP
jgi:hypothetical protein